MTTRHPLQARALIGHNPNTSHKATFTLENLTLRNLFPNEVLVRIIATGICHTDLVFAQEPAYSPSFPRVLGHEGAGYISALGSAITGLSVNDPVLLSFCHCTSCYDCKTGHPAYCNEFENLNYKGDESVFRRVVDGKEEGVSGLFFGQSSFAGYTIVSAASVVSLKGVVESEDELKLFAPLGCGFQTGMGTISNFAATGPEDRVVILGLGGVGLAAVAAARIAGAKTIIGVDRVESRSELAREFGATHVLDTGDLQRASLTEKVMAFTDGRGASITVDTTGNVGLIEEGMDLTGKRGQMILLGVAPYTAEMSIHLISFMQSGKVFRGSIEGDVIPSEFIPKMIQWYRNGQFEIERLVRFYKVDDWEIAMEDMRSGKTIKPVLLW